MPERWSLTVLSVAGVLIVAGMGAMPRPRVGEGAAVPPPLSSTIDSFPHARHAKVACLACHATGDGHGTLTFTRPQGCAECHHKAPSSAKCAICHRAEAYGAPKPATVTVTVPGRHAKPRPVVFLHARHASRSCVECHSTPVSLAPAPAKAACMDCHTDHHAAARSCAACHSAATPVVDHQSVAATHQYCSECHTATIVAALTPARQLCSACHAAQATTHYREKECVACHFLSTPEEYRPKLLKPPAP